jgi:hypothetical protein
VISFSQTCHIFYIESTNDIFIASHPEIQRQQASALANPDEAQEEVARWAMARMSSATMTGPGSQ